MKQSEEKTDPFSPEVSRKNLRGDAHEKKQNPVAIGTPFHPYKIRMAICNSLPVQASTFSDAIEPRFLYVPPGQIRALNPDVMLVRGIRGAGKSVWWSALQSERHRTYLSIVLRWDNILENTVVTPGFGGIDQPSFYPGNEVMCALLLKYEALPIWRMIIARQILEDYILNDMGNSWEDRVRWCVENPELISNYLYCRDQELGQSHRRHLIVFDALDRTAKNWDEQARLLRGLLQLLLELRAYRAIRGKVFLRPDMLASPNVRDFIDASKILANDVSLTWTKSNLYALLWQYLANDTKYGTIFRKECRTKFGQTFGRRSANRQNSENRQTWWLVPSELQENEELQASVFDMISGRSMSERGRERPYTWLPNHLADTQGQVSPRSFLTAMRVAAEQHVQQSYRFALHYNHIKTGVRAASRIRVTEIAEDFPWVETVMKPLWGLVVPCDADEIKSRWDQHRILSELEDSPKRTAPRGLNQGFVGIIRDLEEIGVIWRMRDGRINLPDVYRLGFGLGRRGGIKPVK